MKHSSFRPNLPASIPVQYATLSPCSLALLYIPLSFFSIVSDTSYRAIRIPDMPLLIFRIYHFSDEKHDKINIYCVFSKQDLSSLQWKRRKCRRRKYPPTAYEKSVKTSRSCAKLNISRQSLSAYERGITLPDIYLLIEIADFSESLWMSLPEELPSIETIWSFLRNHSNWRA